MDIRKEEADNKTQDIIQKSSITLDNDDSKGGDNVQTKNSQMFATFDIQNFKPREHLRSGSEKCRQKLQLYLGIVRVCQA